MRLKHYLVALLCLFVFSNCISQPLSVVSAQDNADYDSSDDDVADEIPFECDKNSSPLSGKAGQFATIKVEGVRKPRAYSLAKSPKNEKPNEHTFFIRKVPGPHP